ncbi:MAG: UDP-N-acetylglucosamine 4,6-dehydratase (inverting) [Candidatus Omnitrophica bacterium]|nr:UDP-N-acetylglucosamine 4,6-dehydratase (inverting) [Candidatus Omnitrophota bacterium]
MLNKKVILITGGTGSFGQKMTATILKNYKPEKLIIFSRDEMKQFEMKQRFNQECIRYFIGDVRDSKRLHRAFAGVDYIFHAAALKIVPTAEYDPFEAVKTNILGAENIVNAAIDNKVKKIVALSTDKACNPVNLYGATKLCAEKLFIAANNYSGRAGTQFSVVRYGNVFGSRGSVIPFFRECNKTGEVPITDNRMTRFWITLSQGCQIVLNALKEMNGGEIFIPKLPSMKITDLAKVICPKAKQKVIGIRPGEKLHETLLSADDGIDSYEFKDKYVIYPKIYAFEGRKIEKGKYLGIDFQGYTSANNTIWLNVEQLKRLVENEGI